MNILSETARTDLTATEKAIGIAVKITVKLKPCGEIVTEPFHLYNTCVLAEADVFCKNLPC